MSQFFKSSFTSKKQFGMLSIGMDVRNVERKQKKRERIGSHRVTKRIYSSQVSLHKEEISVRQFKYPKTCILINA